MAGVYARWIAMHGFRLHASGAFVLACVLLLAACGSSEAAPFTWDASGGSPLDDGAGNWNATGGTNWFNGSTYGQWGNTNADTATFGVGNGAAGTITVGGVTANGITFNAAGSGNYTLSSGTITMAGSTPTITVNASGTTTLTSVLAGSAGLTKTGAGTLLLGAGNTYTGTTTITQGIVRVPNINNTLGSGNGGSVVLNGGTIETVISATAAYSPLWLITASAGGGTLLNSSTQAWNLRVNSVSGSGTLTLKGASFNMANSQSNFSGKWVVDAFVDQAQRTWGTATGDDVITLMNNATLFSRGGTLASATQGITISSGTGTFLNAQFAVAATTIPGRLSGAGGARFTPTNGAIITLSNTGNSYAGDTLVAGSTTNRGFLRVGASEVVPDGAGKGSVFIFNNGAAASLDLNGFNETINGLSSLNPATSTLSTDSQVDNLLTSSTSTLSVGGNDASQTFAGVIQNSLSGSNAIVALTKIGSGTQTLSGANTYWGPTNINAGTLRIGAGSTTGALSGSSAISGSAGATLAFERSNVVTQGTNFASVIGGAINVSQLGSGTLVLNGVNTFSGTTRAVAGTLSLNGANALQNSTLDMNADDAGSVLFGITGTNTYNIGGLIGSRNLATSGSVVLSVGGNGSNGTYSGTISGGGAFTKVGAGTLTLSAANTYTGTTSVNAGTLQIGNNGTTGGLASTSVITGSAGATLAFSRTDNYGGNFSNTIGGGLGLTLNSGTLTLSTVNAYTGVTTVNAGVLALGTNGVISNQSNLLVNGGGFNLAGFSDTVGTVTLASGSIFGAGTLGGSSYALQGGTLASVLGSGPITVSTGTTTLGAAGRFNSTSGLTISSGQLTLAGSETVASYTQSGGILGGSGNTLTASTYALQGGTVNADLGIGTLNVTANTALNGVSGATAVNLNSGTLFLGGAGRFTASNVAVTGSSGAAVLLGGSESFGSLAGAANVALGSGTLSVGSANTSTNFSGDISGVGGLIKAGSGALTLTGNNTFSGLTTVSAGTLAMNGQLAGTVAVASGGVLEGSGVIGGVLSGAGLVSPGNSPGILTASQFDPSGGLDAAFELTGLSPVYNAPTASVNDILRLTSGTPFTSSFGGGNVIDFYFNVNSVEAGAYEAGFFTTLSAADLFTALQNATVNYWIKDGSGARDFNGVTYSPYSGVTLSTATVTRDFGAGNVTGSVTQFIVVPEPTSIVLACGGIAVAAWAACRRR